MAQKVLTIPVSFDFRISKVAWSMDIARVVGWRHEPGRQTPKALSARIGRGVQEKSITLLLSQLPSGLKAECLKTLGMVHPDKVVAEVCSKFEVPIFHHSFKLVIANKHLEDTAHQADAWKMRDDFLRQRGDSESILGFLHEWGYWKQNHSYTTWQEMLNLQNSVKNGLTFAPEWYSSGLAFPSILAGSTSPTPGFLVRAGSCEAAIRMATTFDLLQQFTFKICARADCAIPFQVTSNHSRDYCTQYCAHLESVRRKRKEKRPKSV